MLIYCRQLPSKVIIRTNTTDSAHSNVITLIGCFRNAIYIIGDIFGSFCLKSNYWQFFFNIKSHWISKIAIISRYTYHCAWIRYTFIYSCRRSIGYYTEDINRRDLTGRIHNYSGDSRSMKTIRFVLKIASRRSRPICEREPASISPVPFGCAWMAWCSTASGESTSGSRSGPWPAGAGPRCSSTQAWNWCC